MYGETGAAMRRELAALLRLHRVQQRLGEAPGARHTNGLEVRRFRHNVMIWCSQAMWSAAPMTFSNQAPVEPNPFRRGTAGRHSATPAGELAELLDRSRAQTTTAPAALEQLTTPAGNEIVEHWRQAARAAVLAEHDTAANVAAMTAPQAQAIVGDVAAITQALVVLDRRYRNTPGWEPLPHGARLGWAALAAALDVNLGQPDYTVDRLGWRPKTKVVEGPPRPGILGVLQAEHNLVVRLKSFPSAINLRYVVDSQRLLSGNLAPYAARIDQHLADRWSERAHTFARLEQALRRIGGRLGNGGPAAAEGANAVARLRALPADTIVEPGVLGGFQLLFDRLDQRIADVLEEGIDRRVYLERTPIPHLAERSSELVVAAGESFVPVGRATYRDLLATMRTQPAPCRNLPQTSPGPGRADLHAALTHRPEQRANPMSR